MIVPRNHFPHIVMPPVFGKSPKIKVIFLTSKYESSLKFVLAFVRLCLRTCVYKRLLDTGMFHIAVLLQ